MPQGTHHYDKLVMPDELEQTLFLHHSNVIARTGV